MSETFLKSFTNWRAGAFKLRFPNGNVISTTCASGSYSDNHDNSALNWRTLDNPVESNTVEIMIDCPEKLHKKIHKKYDGDGSIIGYLPIEKWVEIVQLLAK